MNNFFGKISIKERVLFAKKLSFLIKAGVPILEGLMILKEHGLSKRRSKMFEGVINDVANGQFLHKSLAKFSNTFDNMAINLIRVGEESGTLSENLEYLAEELKKRQALKRKVVGALIYPIFISIATILIAGLMGLFIFPKILPIFTSLNVKPPLATRILIYANAFIKDNIILLALGIAMLFTAIIFISRTQIARALTQKFILKMPLANRIAKNYHLANFCRTLGLLIKNDIRVVNAFLIAAETTPNLVYKEEFIKISQSISRGEQIALHMKRNKQLFPPMLTHMVSIGEETGSLPDTLIYMSEMYEAEVDELTKNLATIIEPALMIFMGIVVGFIAISVIMPIYQITQNIHP